MTIVEIIGLGVAVLFMFVGVIGSVVPVLPGAALVLAVAVVHKLLFGTASAGWFVILTLTLLTLFSFAIDYLATLYGAKKMGATWRGAVGASIGCLIGMFFAPFGLVLGPFLGALLFEVVGGRDFKQASHAGIGATLGLLAGGVGKLACSMAMTGLFVISTIYNSWH
ncbi:MAG TPA: DUF456 domain-containing protein [Verrucomicrobiae bacterium]|nr:DUF456 domain-containing protein [Verrucomicrobiae bacterium]